MELRFRKSFEGTILRLSRPFYQRLYSSFHHAGTLWSNHLIIWSESVKQTSISDRTATHFQTFAIDEAGKVLATFELAAANVSITLPDRNIPTGLCDKTLCHRPATMK